MKLDVTPQLHDHRATHIRTTLHLRYCTFTKPVDPRSVSAERITFLANTLDVREVHLLNKRVVRGSYAIPAAATSIHNNPRVVNITFVRTVGI